MSIDLYAQNFNNDNAEKWTENNVAIPFHEKKTKTRLPFCL